MLTLMLLVLTTILVVIYAISDYNAKMIDVGAAIISVLVFFYLLFALLPMCCVFNAGKKAALVKEYNAKCEQNLISVIQAQYAHESKVYIKDFKSVLAAINMQPEIKSMHVVQSLMGTIESNNKEIKRLESEAIDASTYKWLVYFGG